MTPEKIGSAIRAYEPDDATAWDDLVERSVNGTILHTRKFLAYTTVPVCNHPSVPPGQGRAHIVTDILLHVIQQGQWSARDQLM